MVPILYADVDRPLHPAATHSMLAHLIDLVNRGEVRSDGPPTIDSVYGLHRASPPD